MAFPKLSVLASVQQSIFKPITIMSLIRYHTPELNKYSPLSNRLRGPFSLFEFAFPELSAATTSGDWNPALDVFEDANKYAVEVELPGVKKEDVNVTVEDGVLTISGETKSQSETKDGTVHRTERKYGKFIRSLSLPAAVKADKVEATYKDGILRIELPKAEESKPKQIKVKVA